MPRFSLVIPTRNRANTLYYTLKTCLNQKEFDDYEVVVSDNGSTDGTEEMVNKLADKKIKYFKTNEVLSMTDSFNFAASKAVGEYQMFLGSDDGIFTYGLYTLNKILNITKVPLICWKTCVYIWPDFENMPFMSNRCHLMDYTNKVITIESTDGLVRSVLGYEKSFLDLPSIYARSAVHVDLLNELHTKTGFIFDSISPDVYFGFAISAVVNYYVNIGIPIILSGNSPKSTGTLGKYKPDSTSITEFFELNKEKGRETKGKFYSYGITRAPIDSIITDDFTCAKKNLNAFKDIEICYKKHIRAIADQCFTSCNYLGNEGRVLFISELEKIRSVIMSDDELKNEYDSSVLDINNYTFYPEDAATFATFDGKRGYVIIDGSQFDIENIYDIILFSEKLMYNKKRIDKYLHWFELWEAQLVDILAKLKEYNRIGFIGAGLFCEFLLAQVKQRKQNEQYEIFLFDNNSEKWGKKMCGFVINSPREIMSRNLDAIIITSPSYYEQIYNDVKNYTCNIKFVDIFNFKDRQIMDYRIYENRMKPTIQTHKELS